MTEAYEYNEEEDDERMMMLKGITVFILLGIIGGLLWLQYYLILKEWEQDRVAFINILNNVNKGEATFRVPAVTNISFSQRYKM